MIKLPKKFLTTVNQYLYHEINHKIHKILQKNSHTKTEEFSKKTLQELYELYSIINEVKPKEEIAKLLKTKE